MTQSITLKIQKQIPLNSNGAARGWNAGMSFRTAYEQFDAKLSDWRELRKLFGCKSIPQSAMLGHNAVEPYSCDYHRGGMAGAKLRMACRQLTVTA